MSGIRERRLEQRKQETLDAAVRMLLERGYANLNMDELADEVGISKPTLYQYFNSKDDLVAEAMTRMFEKMEAMVSEQPDRSPLERLESFLRAMLKARAEQRALLGLSDVEKMRSILHGYPRIRQHMQGTREKLEALVRQAQATGEIDPTFPTWVVVGAVFSLQGIVSRPLQKDEPQRSDAELAAAVDSIVCLFKRGVGAALPLNA